MPQHFRLGVYTFQVAGGNQPKQLFDPNRAPAWLYDPAQRLSLTTYWRDVSAGELVIDADVKPPLLVEDEALAARLQIAAKLDDRDQAVESFRYVLELAGLAAGMAGYDGLVIQCIGFEANGGAAWVVAGGKAIPTALFHELGTHSFMAHELGHVIGLQHPHDLGWTNPNELYGEYGDPHCIMSAETFGGRSVTVDHPHVAGSGIDGTAQFWMSFGPGVSPTTLWRWLGPFHTPSLFSLHPGHVEVLAAGTTRARRTIVRAGVTGRRVVALPDPVGTGYLTVEYRPAVFWDRSFPAPGTRIAPGDAGLVVHHVRDVGEPNDVTKWPGTGYPKPMLVTYRATLRGPLDGGQYHASAGITVDVVSGTFDEVTIDIGVAVPQTPAVQLHLTTSTRDTARALGAGPAVLAAVGRNCDLREIASDVVSTETTVECVASSSGYLEPFYAFFLAGQRLPATAAMASRQLPVRTHFDRYGEARPTSVTVTYTLQGSRLRLTVPPGVGEFDLPLEVRVREHTTTGSVIGGWLSALSSEHSVPVRSTRLELPAAAADEIEACVLAMRAAGEHLWGKRNVHPLDLVARVDPDRWRGLDLRGRVALLAEGDDQLPSTAPPEIVELGRGGLDVEWDRAGPGRVIRRSR